MSKVPQRLVRPSSRSLLTRVLDQPDLPTQIQSLAPVVFGKLIDQVGLEDAGELVALATTEQLAHAFDEDLWKNQRPGEEERFDTDRFLVWLDVLLEAGDAFVASKLAGMPEDLVTLALHKHVLVLDVEALALDMQAADEVDARQLDKALESCLYEEVNGFQLMARDPDGWDSILSVVLALDRDHHDFLQRVIEHCCAMSSEYIEDNGGLYEVLTSDEMLEADVAADREDRRAEVGHVAPSSASAFLKLARSGSGAPQGERDPLTRAYFRNLRPATTKVATRAATPFGTGLPSEQKAPGLARILKEAGVLVETPARHLLSPAAGQGDPLESLLVEAMRALVEKDASAFGERSEELAYLTNVLLAGCSLQQRRLRPIEAVRAAIATCNLGLCLALSARPPARTEDISKHAWVTLRQSRADHLFRSGWHCLNGDVVDPAARAALQLFERAAANADSQERMDCRRAASVLNRAFGEGSPWQALSALDSLLGSVDGWVVDALRGLMDQCPTLPVAVESGPGIDRKRQASQALRYLSTPAALDESRRILDRAAQEPQPAGPAEEPRMNRSPLPSARTSPKSARTQTAPSAKRRDPSPRGKPAKR